MQELMFTIAKDPTFGLCVRPYRRSSTHAKADIQLVWGLRCELILRACALPQHSMYALPSFAYLPIFSAQTSVKDTQDIANPPNMNLLRTTKLQRRAPS